MSRKFIKFYMLGCWGLSINFYLNVLNLIHQSYALLPQHHRRQTIFYFVTSNSVIKFDNDENKSERSENIIFKEIGNQWIFFRFTFSKKILLSNAHASLSTFCMCILLLKILSCFVEPIFPTCSTMIDNKS